MPSYKKSVATSLLLGAAPALAIQAYAPSTSVLCPAEKLVRPANGLNTNEAAYIKNRKAVADESLKSWLAATSADFGTDVTLPSIGLTTSGGGLRALLVGAGVVKGLDSRDTHNGTGGIYQSLTYHTGLSGGGWMLSSIAGNNFPAISTLQEELWNVHFEETLLYPEGVNSSTESYALIETDLLAKEGAGYNLTITDLWGRLLSYQLLAGADGGVAQTLSGVTSLSNFTTYQAPYPILVTIGENLWDGECYPDANSTIYELGPYEFGSWDPAVSAFALTKYLGTSMSNGTAVENCVTGYDNLGFALGTTSNLFNAFTCTSSPYTADTSDAALIDEVLLTAQEFGIQTSNLDALYPNPFYEYLSSTATADLENSVLDQPELYMVDGGEGNQNNPIWPLIRPERNVSVLLVTDVAGDTAEGWPSGAQLYDTYVQSVIYGYTNFPEVPSPDTFIADGMTDTAQVFGCNDDSVMTVVWLPNADWTFASNTSTFQLQYDAEETAAMIDNGVQIANQGFADDWSICLGCFIMHKTDAALPAECSSCLDSYCYDASS